MNSIAINKKLMPARWIVRETRTVSAAMDTGSGSSLKAVSGWWLYARVGEGGATFPPKFIGTTLSDVVENLGL